MTSYGALWIMASISPGDSWFPDDTTPLPEPMLTYRFLDDIIWNIFQWYSLIATECQLVHWVRLTGRTAVSQFRPLPLRSGKSVIIACKSNEHKTTQINHTIKKYISNDHRLCRDVNQFIANIPGQPIQTFVLFLFWKTITLKTISNHPLAASQTES